MNFSIGALHELEEMYKALSGNISEKLKCGGIEDLSAQKLKIKSITKDNLAEIVLSMAAVISESRNVLRSAQVKFDEQNLELSDSRKELIQVQSDLIACQRTKLGAVQDTVQSEMKSYCEIVKKNCSTNSALNYTPTKLKKVVRTAFADEERPKNFLIFGADEELYCKETEMDDDDLVEEIFGVIGTKPIVEKCSRIGIKRTDGPGRPIKVTLRNTDAVRDVLSRAKLLKPILAPDYSFKFSKLYLSADRTEEERGHRQKLVQEMKERIKTDGSKRYYIKDKKVCVRDQ